MNNLNFENGPQIHNDTRSERDKQIFFSLLRNTVGKSDSHARPEIATQEMIEPMSIKVEIIDEEVVGKDIGSCKCCSFMSRNKSFLKNHKLSGHEPRVSKVLSYKCSECENEYCLIDNLNLPNIVIMAIVKNSFVIIYFLSLPVH